MGVLIHHQINAGNGHVTLVPKSDKGYLLIEARVMVVNAPSRGKHGIRVQLGCAGEWELEQRVLRPGMQTFRGMKRQNGQPLHVPGGALLWIEAHDHHGAEITDPLLVATFDLETI